MDNYEYYTVLNNNDRLPTMEYDGILSTEEDVYKRVYELMKIGLFQFINRFDIYFGKNNNKRKYIGDKYIISYSDKPSYNLNNMIWIPRFVNKWIPYPYYCQEECDDSRYWVIASWLDGNSDSKYLSSYFYNRDEFYDTKEECQEYINRYWYHGLCNDCQYDKYSAEHKCCNCKHKMLFDDVKITEDKRFYCGKVFEKCGFKFNVVSSVIRNAGQLICRNYDPIVNNGDWIDFNWYLEVMKNCWYNVGTSCPAQNTICRSQNFDFVMDRKIAIFKLKDLWCGDKEVVEIRIPYLRWLNFDFIDGDKIYCSYISYKDEKSKKKKHNIVQEKVDDYINLKYY